LTLALLLAALLAVVCVVVVALPFLREPEPESDTLDDLKAPEKRRLELLEARDRALGALKELEFEHRTGTISDDDYRESVGPLRREAAAALQALARDESGSGGGEVAKSGEGRPTRERTS
jgi:hypothetical protein